MRFNRIVLTRSFTIAGQTVSTLDEKSGWTDLSLQGDHVVGRFNGELWWVPNTSVQCARVDERQQQAQQVKRAS